MSMTVEIRQAGANSASFYIFGNPPPPDGGGWVLTPEQWNQLPSGKLKDFLTANYCDPPGSLENSEVLWLRSYGDAGVVTTAQTYFDTSNAFTWFLSPGPEGGYEAAKGSAMLTVPWSPFGSVVRISVAYSASE